MIRIIIFLSITISKIRRIRSFTTFIKINQYNPSSSSSQLKQQPAYGLYEVQEELITKRALYEENMMKGNYAGPIESTILKGAGGGGFGSTKPNKATLRTQGKGYAQVLKKDGVVRIDNILSKEQCNELSDFIAELRIQSENDIREGIITQSYRYADVLLRKNRCDLTMPLNDITLHALNTILNESAIGTTIENALGKKALLYEFSCLISDYGSDRQNVHPDTPIYDNDDDIPVLYTCFIVLQDVDIDMGPTLWMPNTHTADAHSAFQQGSDDDTTPNPKDNLLKSKPYVLGILPTGACGIFDSRLLHCGTSNKKPNSNRKVFYVSFQNPKIGFPGNPPSIRPELKNKLSLDVLKKELSVYCNPKKRGKSEEYPVIHSLMTSMK